MLRKGALESGLGEIILTVLVAAVISGAMFGPLGAKIGEGFKEAEQFTDLTTQVTVSDSETLGDLAQYSFWRAWSCDKVGEETFQGLVSTNLTEDGRLPCAGAGGTAASSVQNFYSNTGNDMEGKYSRVNFVINETITLKTGEGFGPDDGKSASLLGVSTGTEYDKAGYSDWVWGDCTAYDAGVSDGYMRGEDWESQGPPYSYFTLFFKNGGAGDRIQRHGDGATIEDRYASGGENDPLYCNEYNDGPWLTKPSSKTGNPKDYDSTGDSYVEVKLCPGDKGYVETRKANPTTTGESTGSIGSNNNDELYGMIQITQMNGSSCGENFIPSVPDDATTRGNMLFVYMDVDDPYPSVKNFQIYDRTEGLDNDIDTGNDIYPPSSDVCRVNLEEDDPAVDDQGSLVDFRQGGVIPHSGPFPPLDSSDIENSAFDSGNLNPVPGEQDGDDVYEALTNHGMNGYVLGSDYDLLAGSPNDRMTMHGDLLCGIPDGSSRAKWIMCDPSEPINSIEINGDNWECDLESGVWSQE